MIELGEEEVEQRLEEYMEESEPYGLSVNREEDLLEVSLTYQKGKKPSLTSALDKLLDDHTVKLSADNRPSEMYDSWREEVYSISPVELEQEPI